MLMFNQENSRRVVKNHTQSLFMGLSERFEQCFPSPSFTWSLSLFSGEQVVITQIMKEEEADKTDKKEQQQPEPSLNEVEQDSNR